MPRKLELSGQRFDRLMIEKEVGRDKQGRVLWKCKCDCGNIAIVSSSNLRRESTKSCGCLQREKTTKHGMAHSKTYSIWEGIIGRCNNPNDTAFTYYGGRGIRVCDRWLDFRNFYSDMGKCPKQLTIERVDNEKDYLSSNCRWATRAEQAHNTRLRKDNTTGFKGVYKHGKTRFRAAISSMGKYIHLGTFIMIEEAIEARRKGEIKYWKKGE